MLLEHNKSESPDQVISCTWSDNSDCTNCNISGELDCKWQKHLLLRFYKGAGPLMIFAVIGFVLIGLNVSWIPALIYIGFWIFFFGFFEIKVLCSHCPYYAEEGKILHCLANHGTIKLWAYNPNPMNSFEKFGFLAGAFFFVFFPVLAEIYGLMKINRLPIVSDLLTYSLVGLIALGLIGGIFFFYILQKEICPKCVNFSCPLNRVPKKVLDAYLNKNPIMKKAWLDCGYQME
jgi:hypothetical protein